MLGKHHVAPVDTVVPEPLSRLARTELPCSHRPAGILGWSGDPAPLLAQRGHTRSTASNATARRPTINDFTFPRASTRVWKAAETVSASGNTISTTSVSSSTPPSKTEHHPSGQESYGRT